MNENAFEKERKLTKKEIIMYRKMLRDADYLKKATRLLAWEIANNRHPSYDLSDIIQSDTKNGKRYKNWTELEICVLNKTVDRRNLRETLLKVADITGRSYSEVYYKYRNLSSKRQLELEGYENGKGHYHKWTREDDCCILKYYRKIDDDYIAKKLNRTIDAIKNRYYILKRREEKNEK